MNIAVRKISFGEDINSNVESCCVNVLRDWFSHLQENSESMCLPHSQWYLCQTCWTCNWGLHEVQAGPGVMCHVNFMISCQNLIVITCKSM